MFLDFVFLTLRSISETCTEDTPFDIIFVLDGSTSVAPSDFESMKRFIVSIVSDTSAKARVAAIQFTNKVTEEIALTDNNPELEGIYDFSLVFLCSQPTAIT